MSSWKRAAKFNQRIHQERHQPENRKELGLLEKKKDYKLRARDNEEKRKQLLRLKRKALNRNPDEFHFHMINSRVIDGQHHENRKKSEHTDVQLKLMETQDMKYIISKRTTENRKIDRLQSQLHLLDEANRTSNKHTFFVDDEKDAVNFDVAKHLNTHEMLLDNKVNRLTLEQLKHFKLPDIDSSTLETINNEKLKKLKQLTKRIKREKELSIINRKLEIQRHMNNKRESKGQVIKKGNRSSAPIVKWNYERKK